MGALARVERADTLMDVERMLVMVALQTSMPERAPAKAVVAAGMSVPAAIARANPAGRYGEPGSENRPFRDADEIVSKSLEGAPAV